MSFDNLEDP